MLQSLYSRLSQYDVSEARSIVRLLLMDTFGLTLTDICGGALNALTEAEQRLLEELMVRLEEGEPVQYVTGKAFFCNREFRVRPGCLIPRPETEELCQWIITEANNARDILDIGTGSGCIAITLKACLPDADITAWDISSEALEIAQENAEINRTDVRFAIQDTLSPPDDIDRWDIIVSNPPYICQKEADTMERNVLDYEPQQALFVPDKDALLFYNSIIRYAVKALKPDGILFFEINPIYAHEVKAAMEAHGFNDVCIRKDMNDKMRMARGRIQK
ncbi:MAG: peptide chain release factor N(5)-glutamine methyltransferase [Prevotella sp.]|nr:peptide chain release factor N(5)-glutamine methyltransferase [Prevotella sp.]